MSDSDLTIEQVFENVGWIAKWEARGEERNSLNIAQNMVNRGYPIDDIVSITNLDPEKVKALTVQG